MLLLPSLHHFLRCSSLPALCLSLSQFISAQVCPTLNQSPRKQAPLYSLFCSFVISARRISAPFVVERVGVKVG
ncbi:hypothetical protein IWX46DRAFT_598719 [Phyllosticta citricarpa]|uniref:Secreted protein n=1 Tax=Phyllosticta citricarpa TaxID=55181 RepID=A0ABR1MEC9_9PEZI